MKVYPVVAVRNRRCCCNRWLRRCRFAQNSAVWPRLDADRLRAWWSGRGGAGSRACGCGKLFRFRLGWASFSSPYLLILLPALHVFEMCLTLCTCNIECAPVVDVEALDPDSLEPVI